MKKLNRTLTLPAIIAISIGGMLGSGIFVLPGIAAAKTGSSIWLAYLIAAILIVPAVLSKSELATAIPKSGGAYVYIERAFGSSLWYYFWNWSLVITFIKEFVCISWIRIVFCNSIWSHIYSY